jgi:hypothetical protein
MEPLKSGWDNARLPNIIIRGLALPESDAETSVETIRQ